MSSIDYSIIIPAYNASAFILRAIDSVRFQDYDSWEIVIVENGSSDDTFEIANKIACEYENIKLVQSDKGVSNARNLGIEVAQGDWLLFLDADDALLPGALRCMAGDIDSPAAFISYRYEHNASSEKKSSYEGNEQINAYLIECLENPTQRCNSTAVLFNRSFIVDHGIRFDSNLTHAEDSVFLIRSIMEARLIRDCELPIYRVILNENSAVRSMSDMSIENYCNSIRLIDKTIGKRDSMIDNAFCVFSISQLLVILVNGVYKGKHFKQAIEKTRVLCEKATFKECINRVDLSSLSLSKRLVIWCMKRHFYILVGLIVEYRVLQKQIRSKIQLNR